MAKLLVINGPNLNLLGQREPELYGALSLGDLERRLVDKATEEGHELVCFQSNAEADLIERIHRAGADETDLVIINPGAYTHTSVALRDAFLGVSIPFVEVHISNIHARETFRKESYLSDIALGVITGFGPIGYEFAIEAAVECLSRG